MNLKPGMAVILAHGDRPSYELLLRLRQIASAFLATVGAANELTAIGIHPDIVLGDFDSAAADLRNRLPNTKFVHAPDQEASDLDKALEYVAGLGFKRITIVGATGGRIDHTLANVSLLMKYAGQLEVQMVDDRTEIRAIADSAELTGHPGDTISLVPFQEVASVELTGVRWPLSHEALLPGSRGVSNELVGSTAHLRVSGGPLICVHRHVNDTGWIHEE